jgi:hypothetical protein
MDVQALANGLAKSCRWWSLSGSNRRPPACKAGALPAELNPPDTFKQKYEPSFVWVSALKIAGRASQFLKPKPTQNPCRLVGLVGLEPTTPALSTQCSNQLSYRPAWISAWSALRCCGCGLSCTPHTPAGQLLFIAALRFS